MWLYQYWIPADTQDTSLHIRTCSFALYSLLSLLLSQYLFFVELDKSKWQSDDETSWLVYCCLVFAPFPMRISFRLKEDGQKLFGDWWSSGHWPCLLQVYSKLITNYQLPLGVSSEKDGIIWKFFPKWGGEGSVIWEKFSNNTIFSELTPYH